MGRAILYMEYKASNWRLDRDKSREMPLTALGAVWGGRTKYRDTNPYPKETIF